MLKDFYKPKELLSLNFQQPPKRATFSYGFCPCKRSASVGSLPECYQGSFQEQGWAWGSHSANPCGWVCWQRGAPSPLPAYRVPSPGGLHLVRSATCLIRAGRKEVALNCLVACHHGPCRQDTHSQAWGFLKL